MIDRYVAVMISTWFMTISLLMIQCVAWKLINTSFWFKVFHAHSRPWNTLFHSDSYWFKVSYYYETICFILIHLESRCSMTMSYCFSLIHYLSRLFIMMKQTVSLLIHPDSTCFISDSSLWFVPFYVGSTCFVIISQAKTVIFRPDSTFSTLVRQW